MLRSASSSAVPSYEATQHDCVSDPATEAATDGVIGVGGASFSGVKAPADLRAVTAAAICSEEKACCGSRLPFPPLSPFLPFPPFPPLPLPPGDSDCLSGLR